MSLRQARQSVAGLWQDIRPYYAGRSGAMRAAAHAWEDGSKASLAALEEYFWGSASRFALLVCALNRHLPHGASILDAGAGHGLLAACLKQADFAAYACDIHDGLPVFDALGIPYRRWHLEADPAPYEPAEFDAVVLSQTIEHFTYSPKEPLKEILRITKPGGIVLIDAPNIAAFRNVWRLLRGKSLHWNLRQHYLEQEPVYAHGIPYYDRHNHEYCMQDMHDIAAFFNLELIEARYYSSYNEHKRGRLTTALSRLRDSLPHWRKSLYAIFQRPQNGMGKSA